MNIKIPFVDLKLQCKPIENQLQQAIQGVLDKGDFVLGQALKDFEVAFAAACGTTHGIGVASGTDAIVLGLQACNIQPGDEVILPANTFVATLIAVLRTGAKPILVDCDAQTALIDLDAAAQAVTPRTKAIIPVHLYGQMVSPTKLLDFAKTHKVLIFEDAAQAHLAQRDGYWAGSVGIAAAFSFYPSKNLGAYGDGGMVVTRDPDIAEKLRCLRNYGASQKYFHVEFGTNSRLDTLQAAILLSKLPYLTSWNRERLKIARQYDTELAPLASSGIIPIQNQSNDGHVYHLYVIKVKESCGLKRQALQKLLADAGIQTGIHYPLPCHLQPAFATLGYQPGDFPHAEKLADEILSLPMYPGLTNSQVKEVVAAISFHLSEQQNKLLYI
ncbi:DegT/DnrJ/EryC1/StrS family aminotransferase [Aetokthonos hydrillicola Thurmond2011]|jgi:dTDP-4-amino-4,6-dideoxygalactose transaminase|uniref:DegT/DnrJ/EryC1/StrS family aminotransferase n=1 Tax=Aetokthonos hydrillicola Thurmond2011 TaxID=2712845 RepID=A0AAP5IGB9_9CYAN|nr:DegT/DnrJ/EryC1/StrS family aminotransferase [Aetokthonos hydrillicola]MBO3462366.1 DegT/DnrJ/EryC1/StrS family aminotransferase [Aetokthonos hydrillicola CCALA 1050]MBW4584217.1 DegT/DnrJ/EryC1/StrS family aminotransferase [Aetokthonos hydrillicola CCALA 1050]MDR9898575.1 DegT/DnrJ/EryC1/StrS family aminotransferase [Aetokthonos hydrillicola Thurmond2011]